MSAPPHHRPVIVGSGLAGLLTALQLAPAPCVVLTTGPLGSDSSTGLAQGGIAAALAPGDSPALHALDTLAAGAGLTDPAVAERITAAAAEAVGHLAGLGTRFDRDPDGTLMLGLEGAHRRHRIVHAGGDATGREVLRALVTATRRTPSVTVLEHTRALRILAEDGAVLGIVVSHRGGPPTVLHTGQVVLATGGVGGLYEHSTNPAASRGQGLALAARAGATLRDVELVQFHPTALDTGIAPMPLVSEAVRGAGARLVDERGHDLAGDPLAARDVVARAVAEQLRDGGRVYLDTREVPDFAGRFPTVTAACRATGIDPARDLVPVRPAAHYHMGGVAVDRHGRTDVSGLWAVGEVASTGLHGANRLASNSLLEAAVSARWVAQDLAGHRPLRRTSARLPSPAWHPSPAHPSPAWHSSPARHATSDLASGPGPTIDNPASRAMDLGELRSVVSGAVGLLRDGATLAAAVDRLHAAHRAAPEDDDALVALLLATAALRREESRGAHQRTDFPYPAAPAHHTITLADVARPALERSVS